MSMPIIVSTSIPSALSEGCREASQSSQLVGGKYEFCDMVIGDVFEEEVEETLDGETCRALGRDQKEWREAC